MECRVYTLCETLSEMACFVECAMKAISERLMQFVIVFGIQQNDGQATVSGVADDVLKQLEESKMQVMKQQRANDILAQFGLNKGPLLWI